MNAKPACIIIHGSTFFAPIIVPLLFMLLTQDDYVKEKATEALLFHVMMTIAAGIAAILMLVLIGFLLLPILGLIALYYPLKGIWYAIEERPFRYPIVHNWVR
ncbi:hypothetical protein DFP93_10568 [Aneurinibacillus soli]|uniref:Uncharacterized protein n=1 Tax=Aneurinibacillus soli TaxID=1500254 RepID=A0A0U4WJE9_9BACL|nr:DUF4870 domain-containing protein [Aneurinibacillus soli]PYE62115.1 hypothetical protein DFP93_10568 [Aneurinibacillus soli]BAU28697.1 hypothetical protein CB4_02872 [Aneurinibacillus soli]